MNHPCRILETKTFYLLTIVLIHLSNRTLQIRLRTSCIPVNSYQNSILIPERLKDAIPVFNGHLTPLNSVELLLRINNYFHPYMYFGPKQNFFNPWSINGGCLSMNERDCLLPRQQLINLLRQNFWASNHQKRVRSVPK